MRMIMVALLIVGSFLKEEANGDAGALRRR